MRSLLSQPTLLSALRVIGSRPVHCSLPTPATALASLGVRCCTHFSLIQDLKDAITQTEHYGQDSPALSMVSTALSHPLGFQGHLQQDLGFPQLTQSATERDEDDISFP